ncbi:SPOR domain-containing protein [Polaribacter sp.]|jgi:septal ring-binding cell division protein DamX|uniref:SPOR domain-containing protein n=1 Tax=Polaribacter sp. TaxID=1920175 RepID=UPI003F69BF8C
MKNKVFLIVFFFIATTYIVDVKAQNKTNSSKEIKELIAKKRAFNDKYGYGYTIQIYYGNETKARSLRSKFRIDFPKVSTNLNYEQPYWKVQVGNYKTRLEADKAALKFSEKFSGLIVIPLGK